MTRRLGATVAISLLCVSGSAVAGDSTPADGQRLVVFADIDDDDDDGVPDAQAGRIDASLAHTQLRVENPNADRVTLARGALRFLSERRVLGSAHREKEFFVQGVSPGPAQMRLGSRSVAVQVLGVQVEDRAGRPTDPVRSHASISRSLPEALQQSTQERDDDMVRIVVAGPAPDLPTSLHVVSVDQAARPLDRLGDVALSDVPCPSALATQSACRATPFIRASSDDIDRSHPGAAAASLRAEVGGKIRVTHAGGSVVSLRVGGPRITALGSLDRYRAKLRVHLMRQATGGAPPIGGNETAARKLIHDDVRAAAGIWGQCGISFGADKDVAVHVVDPPQPFLLAVGCERGLPASGGSVRLQVDDKTVKLATRPGDTPRKVADALRAALAAEGFLSELRPNPRTVSGAQPTYDVIVKRRGGQRATLSSVGPLSSDPTLEVCLGVVELSDGLTHFSDFTASAGTIEERALIRAVADDDPTSIEVIVIPSFARTGRIGESFIYADGGSIRNVVIIDRAALVAGARSYTLAHELGHIFLDMPGHPDDYGVDRPSDLMDADAADPTIFGPRRLSVSECERAQRQSGAGAPLPLLSHWPLIRAR
jgi:hypothetical protein